MMRKIVFLLVIIVFIAYAEWIPTSPLLQGHSGHVAVKLGNGDVLIIGGDGSKDCQIYDHETETWAFTDSLNIGRQDFTAVLLEDGRVMVIGGGVPYNLGHGTCELYDTTTHTWAMTDTLNTTRGYARAVVLNDGRVLVTGGLDIMTLISACEIYDPTTETWTPTSQPSEPQWGHDLCLLDNGRVLSVGGFRDFGMNMAGCHIFDPVTETWTATNPLNYRRWKLTAVRLITDDVLVVGGQNASFVNIPQCEVYNVSAGTWTVTSNNINPGRIGHTCTKLQNPDPRVWLIGGESALSDCEFFHAYAGLWEDTDALIPGREDHSATLLDNGNILVTGGTPNTTDCQIFDPPPYGISEQKVIETENAAFTTTILNGPLLLPHGKNCKVLDITGRTIEPQHISPGIYFIEIEGVIAQKVIKVR